MSENSRVTTVTRQPCPEPVERMRLNHLIETISKALDPVLFAPESLAIVQSLAAQLPPVNFQLFEVRLSSDNPSIDLSVPLTDELLADRSHWCLNSPWQEIFTLKKACQIDGEFAAAIGYQVFWGEFDCDRALPTIPTPGIFFDVSEKMSQPENRPEFARIVCRAWEILLGKALPESSQTGIKTALAALPDGVCSTHFGIMLPRLLNETILPNSLRLHPACWQIGDITRWLKVVGAGAVVSEVERVIQEIPHLLQRAIVTVDGGATVGSRVGIECYPATLETVNSGSNQSRWMEEFTNWLVTNSLASPDKARALLDWDIQRILSIDSFQEQDDLLNYSVCCLNLSHLKLVFEPGRGLQAKAYLLANFRQPKQTERKIKSDVLKSFDNIWVSSD